MSVEIRIDSYDISDMEERLDRAFDIRNGWGSEAVDEHQIIDVERVFPEGSVHAVIQKQQIQLTEQLEFMVSQQEKINTLIAKVKKLDTTVNQITDCLDSAAQNIFNIGLKVNSKAMKAEVK